MDRNSVTSRGSDESPPARTKEERLVLAARKGDTVTVERMLRQNADINARCFPPLGPLNNGLADVYERNTAMSRFQITDVYCDMRPSDPQAFMRTALQAAAEGGHEHLVRRLLAGGADVNASAGKGHGRTALQAAAECGHEKIVSILIDAHADVNSQPAEIAGRTALQAAAERGHLEIVNLLMNCGAEINQTAGHFFGRTALQAAASIGRRDIVLLLLDNGAEVNAPSSHGDGKTALQAAVERGYEDLVALLIKRGADCNFPGPKSQLAIATDAGHRGVARILREAGACDDGDSRLSLNGNLVSAAGAGNLGAVERLLARGADAKARCPPRILGQSLNCGKITCASISWETYETLTSLEFRLYNSPDTVKVSPDSCARTAIQVAAEGGYQEIVELLIQSGADVNAPAAESFGRTALQAAVEAGHRRLVILLLEAGANVNAPAANLFGRTALQAAAETANHTILELLIEAGATEKDIHWMVDELLVSGAGQGDSETVNRLLKLGADPNARYVPPLGRFHEGKLEGPFSGSSWEKGLRYAERTALQAAAEFAHMEVVNMLIAAGANVNAPPARVFGRTALQAAAESGFDHLVTVLLDAQANINAKPADIGGRTALQAAADGGYEDTVDALIIAGADCDADPSPKDGKTALQAAAEGWHEEVVAVLVRSNAESNMKDHLGQTLLHKACKAGDVHQAEILLRLALLDINEKDFSGSTPLHIAARENHELLVRFLTNHGAIMETNDNSGLTPLQIALENGSGSIMDTLISKGAKVEGVQVMKLPGVRWSHRISEPFGFGNNGSGKEDGILMLYGGAHPGISKRSKTGSTTISNLLSWQWKLPSLCLLSPSTKPMDSAGLGFSSDPRKYLKGYTWIGNRPIKTNIEWAWMALGDMGAHDAELPHSQGLEVRIPRYEEVIPLKAQVIIICYLFFDAPIYVSGTSAASNLQWDSTVAIKSLEFKTRKIEISWIMRSCSTGPQETTVRSTNYRGTIRMNYMSIPRHAVEFVILFLDEYQESWMSLLKEAGKHLAEMHEAQLVKAGQDPSLINCLLKDIQQWTRLRTIFEHHSLEAKKLLKQFATHDILYQELFETIITKEMAGKESADAEVVPGDLSALRALSSSIESLNDTCTTKLDSLDKQTILMIEMEFNLVSIFEARESVSMAVSMKRLSWITFIFLPLLFVSGLFGMNVDILQSSPSWRIYIAFAFPTMAIVFFVWILFKYKHIAKWVEYHIRSRLERCGQFSIISTNNAGNWLEKVMERVGNKNESSRNKNALGQRLDSGSMATARQRRRWGSPWQLRDTTHAGTDKELV